MYTKKESIKLPKNIKISCTSHTSLLGHLKIYIQILTMKKV